MKVHSYAFGILVMLALSLTFISCDDDDNMVEEPTIVGFAQENADFSTLVDAVVAADLVDVLNDRNGTYTVFAPTNAAFNDFLAANNFSSLSDIPVDLLRQVLLFHVFPTVETSTALATQYYPTAAEFDTDEPINVFINTDGGVRINGTANVTGADNDVANGVIHAIDAVIVPATVVTQALANPDFSILVAALTREDLTTNFVEILSGTGPFTVFAPTNSAFEALLASNNEWNTLADIPVETLDAVLRYHVVNGANVRAGDIVDDADVASFQGATFSIDLDGGPTINAGSNTANIIATDVQASNGVVHAIDAVILP